jgi:flagellar hook-basal body protein
MRALSIAATGMAAQQSNVEVIANNIANVNTTGFKRSRAEFSDLLYQTERVGGVPGRSADLGCELSVCVICIRKVVLCVRVTCSTLR